MEKKNSGRKLHCLPTQSQAVISAEDVDIQSYIRMTTE